MALRPIGALVLWIITSYSRSTAFPAPNWIFKQGLPSSQPMAYAEQDPIQVRCLLSSPALMVADASRWSRQAKRPIVPR